MESSENSPHSPSVVSPSVWWKAAVGCLCILIFGLGFTSSLRAQTVEVELRDQPNVETLFYRGLARYQAGDYGPAAFAFQRAAAIRREPDLLYNVARCHERSGNHRAAIAWYSLYNHERPIDASAVLQRISSLSLRMSEASTSANTLIGPESNKDKTITMPILDDALAQAALDPPLPMPENAMFWVGSGLGAAGLLGGLTFVVLGLNADGDASSASGAERDRLDRSADTYKNVAAIGFLMGALGLGTASWLWYDSNMDDDDILYEGNLEVGPTGASLTGHF